MPISDWVKDDEGNIMALPLAGFETVAVGGMAILLRVTAQRDGDRPGTATAAFQFAASPTIAIQLAEDLLMQAKRIADSHKGPHPQNG